jgi:hypothetical protein
MEKFDKVVLEQLAKNKSIKDIAKEQDVDEADIKKELIKGTKTEHEHTGSDKKAKAIAKDHLVEDPKYYSKLKQAGL